MGRLFWKCFFAFWLALLMASVGVGTGVWLHQRALPGGEQETVEGGPRAAFMVQATAAVLRHIDRGAMRDFLLEAWHADPYVSPVFVVDEVGQELLNRPVSTETLAQARHLAQADREPRSARLERIADHDYLLFVSAEGQARPYSRRHGPPSPLPLILTGLLASLGFSALLAWYLSTPIRHLRAAFEAVAAGRLDTRIGPRMGRRRDEIADLGRDFDRMAEQLDSLVGAQRRLLHDVSHELRSPLARLQAAIGLARQRPEKLAVSLDRIEREASRLDRLVGELLTLSRLVAGIAGAADETIDLVELAREVVADARFEAETAGRQVLFSAQGEALVTVRPAILLRALENVVRNAVKFTPPETAVELAVTQYSAPERVVVTVVDQGPGVPEGELQRIFEPFFRSESRPPSSGFGLGLAIARRAIEAHGGQIRALNRPGGGLLVEIVLPAASAG